MNWQAKRSSKEKRMTSINVGGERLFIEIPDLNYWYKYFRSKH
jgi:hypothetical protein